MAEGLSGSVAQIPLTDLLKMLAAGAQTGRLRLTSGIDVGDIYVYRGDLCHAESDGLSGEAAFLRVLGWPNATFKFEPGITAIDRTIEKTVEMLVADAVRIANEREAIRRVIPSMDAIPRLVPELPAPTVTIDADDWRLLARMDGATTFARIGRDLRMEEGELLKQLVRLRTAGLFDMDVSQAPAAQPGAPAREPAQKQLAGPQFFLALTAAVADAMGPLAEVIVDDTVEAMGFTQTTFPREAVSQLCERIAAEIRDDAHRMRFQQTVLSMLRSRAA